MPTSIDPPAKDDEIECAQCGTYFYYELTRCPHCGISIYGSDDETEEPPVRNGVFARIATALKRLLGKGDSAETLFNAALAQGDLYHNLLLKVDGDARIAERLIEYEKQRLPNATRVTWLKNAIMRWEDDNQ